MFFVNCNLFTSELTNELTSRMRLVPDVVNINLKASLAST